MGSIAKIGSAKEARHLIEQQYVAFGYKAGWRYLYTPERTLKTAKLVTVGLKPGGYRPNVGHPEGYWAPAIGNAHLIDVVEGHAAGEAPLQQQIRMMFDMLHYDLDTEILSLNYVPFRCTDWESLPHEGEALLLGERLWEWVIHQLDCPLIVCFGKSVLENRIAGSVGARFVEDIPTGWGNICASIYEYGKLGRLVSLPHLSRFKIFGRSEFTEVDRVFGPQHLKKG
jgi:hypothetical protein